MTGSHLISTNTSTEKVVEIGWPFGGRPTPRRIWSLWKAGGTMACEINAHPRGHEVRLYHRGALMFSHQHETPELAEAEAIELKCDCSADGWTGRLPLPR